MAWRASASSRDDTFPVLRAPSTNPATARAGLSGVFPSGWLQAIPMAVLHRHHSMNPGQAASSHALQHAFAARRSGEGQDMRLSIRRDTYRFV